MRISEREIRAYCREVRRLLPLTWREKRKAVKNLRESIDAFLEEQPFIPAGTFEEQFGPPEEIALTYAEDLNTPEVLRSLRHGRLRTACAIIAACACLLLALAATVRGLNVQKEADTEATLSENTDAESTDTVDAKPDEAKTEATAVPEEREFRGKVNSANRLPSSLQHDDTPCQYVVEEDDGFGVVTIITSERNGEPLTVEEIIPPPHILSNNNH